VFHSCTNPPTNTHSHIKIEGEKKSGLASAVSPFLNLDVVKNAKKPKDLIESYQTNELQFSQDLI